MLTGILIFAIITAIAASRRADPRRRPGHRTGPRLREGPQVVGFPCAKCGDRIIFDTEAVPCATCGKPIHLTCMPHVHDDATSAPYRS